MGILTPLMDSVLLVVRSGVTSKPAIHDAVAAIDASKLLGGRVERRLVRILEGQRATHVMQVFNRHVSGRGLTVFGFETMLISGSILLAAAAQGLFASAVTSVWRVVLITALCELCFYYNDLYDLTVVHSKNELAVRLLQGAGAAAIVLAVVSVVIPTLIIGHGIFMTSLCLLLVAVPVWRLAFDGLTLDSHLEERVLILGTGPMARTLARQILAQHDFAYRLVGFVPGPDSDDERGESALGTATTDLATLISRHHVDRVVVSLSDRRGTLPIRGLLQAKLSGVRVEDAATMYERITGKILIDAIKPSWLIFSDGFRASRAALDFVKRGVDSRARGRRSGAGGAVDAADGHRGPARLARPRVLLPGTGGRGRTPVHVV